MRKQTRKSIMHFLKGKHYVCNEAATVTKEKTAKVWAKVTCRNCLRKKKK